MNKKIVFKRTLLSLIMGGIGATPQLMAAPLNLAQYPAGSASVEPAPNVIVSVDDSGSMGTSGIASLKAALQATFAAGNIPDDRIRLAWQSMNRCSGIPSVMSACSSKNTMKSLSGVHRTNFMTWVNTLSANGWTPSFPMVRAAGDYLRTTGANSPWNKTPGTADSAPISCRKSFHVFMTDGEWNGADGTTAYADADRMTEVRLLKSGSANLDSTSTTLPDSTSYDPTSNQTRAYRDDWGFASFTAQRRTRPNTSASWTAWQNYTDNNGMNTLADLAFNDWATDLQPAIANEMVPVIKKSGPEIFGTGGTAFSLPEYWNPKNNPATWQNMVTYTIGFNAAATLTRPTTAAPLFDATAAIDEATHAGEFWKLMTGEKVWPTPFCGASGNVPCESETSADDLKKISLGSPTDRDQYTDSKISNGRMYELWHMAINGRGKFMPATSSAALAEAFKKILNQIIEDTTKPITSFASTSTNNTRTDIGEFISGYDASGWKGYVRSDTIAKTNGARSANLTWGTKAGADPEDRVTTADKLDALSFSVPNRLILTTNDVTNKGVSFEWEAGITKLSAAQKTLLNASSKGQDRLNFIRGDRTKEATAPFRIRLSRQGDIVNSNIWYVGAPASNLSLPGYLSFTKSNLLRNPMIYVGGNDGMLHGFSGTDGTEKIAFVPKGVIANLHNLSASSYTHQYYVDGSPFTGDVNWGVNDWRTLLVGTLGAGGKGYFLMDVTKPGTTDGSISSNFSTGNASDLVVMDNTWHKTDAQALDTTKPEADLGYIFANPVVDETNPYKVTQVTRMNNGKWAVVMGNGYNSTNERPVLLIQFVDKASNDMTLKRIVAASSGNDAEENGLSAPRLVDINGDGTPDVAYAGDLKGNIWKFDLSSSNPGDWGIAFSGQPLYKAVHTSGATSSKQPITVPPTVKPNDRGAGGMMVAFGTGRNITEGDRTDTTSKHTIYSVLDNTIYKLVSGKVTIDAAVTPTVAGTGTSNLVQQTMTPTAVNGAGVSSGRTFWKLSQNPVNYIGAGAKKGWYFTLPEPGERQLKPINFYDGSNNLEVISQVPASGGNSVEELCDPSPTEEKQFRTFLNIMDGKRPGVQVMDANGDGVYINAVGEDEGVSRMSTSKGAISNTTGKNASGDIRNVATGADGKKDIFAPMPEQPMRPSWRQLQ